MPLRLLGLLEVWLLNSSSCFSSSCSFNVNSFADLRFKIPLPHPFRGKSVFNLWMNLFGPSGLYLVWDCPKIICFSFTSVSFIGGLHSHINSTLKTKKPRWQQRAESYLQHLSFFGLPSRPKFLPSDSNNLMISSSMMSNTTDLNSSSLSLFIHCERWNLNSLPCHRFIHDPALNDRSQMLSTLQATILHLGYQRVRPKNPKATCATFRTKARLFNFNLDLRTNAKAVVI